MYTQPYQFKTTSGCSHNLETIAKAQDNPNGEPQTTSQQGDDEMQ